MKIAEIQVQGVLGIERVDLKLAGAPVHLFCGRNRSGKSSLRDAVASALKKDVEVLRGVSKVKDYGALVHEGLKAGGAVVTMEGDDGAAFAFHLPKGAFSGPEITDAMAVAVDGQRFASMSIDERRAFLFKLTGQKMTPATIKPRMLAAGCAEALVDQVLPELRTGGFPAGEKFAAAEALAAKRAWQAAAGRSAYAPKDADSWAAPVPDLPAHDLAALAAAIITNEQATATLNESLGKVRQAQQQAKDDAERRAHLAGAVARVPELEKLLPAAIKERDDYQAMVEQLRERAKGKARVGLVHDLAQFVFTEKAADAARAVLQAQLIGAYTKEHGPIDAGAAPDPEAIARLPDHESGLKVLVNRAANLQRDLDAAKMAKGQYDALAPAGEEVDSAAAIAEIQRMLQEAQDERKRLVNQKLDVEAATRGRAEAAKKTADAKAAHQLAQAWIKIGERMSPSGILAEMLAESIAQVNDKLEQAAVDTSWPQVVLGADTSLEVGGRPYALESESGQWRADCMIAQVVAEISGLKLMLLDRMDVLDAPDRGVLLNWLDTLHTEGLIDTALVFATLRKPPRSSICRAHWMEYGWLVPFEQSRDFDTLPKEEQDAWLTGAA